MNRRTLILTVIFTNLLALIVSIVIVNEPHSLDRVSTEVVPSISTEPYLAVPMFAIGKKSYFSLKHFNSLNNEGSRISLEDNFQAYSYSFPQANASVNVISDIYSFYCLREFAEK